MYFCDKNTYKAIQNTITAIKYFVKLNQFINENTKA